MKQSRLRLVERGNRFEDLEPENLSEPEAESLVDLALRVLEARNRKGQALGSPAETQAYLRLRLAVASAPPTAGPRLGRFAPGARSRDLFGRHCRQSRAQRSCDPAPLRRGSRRELSGLQAQPEKSSRARDRRNPGGEDALRSGPHLTALNQRCIP